MKEFNNADYLSAKNECGFDLNPESRIPNPESRIPNPEKTFLRI
jgi:hypothetical protein